MTKTAAILAAVVSIFGCAGVLAGGGGAGGAGGTGAAEEPGGPPSFERFSIHYSGFRSLWSPSDDALSPYDAEFRHVADLWRYDWRFLAALAWAESRFDPEVRSSAGAVGLMQVMPSAAERFNIPMEDIREPLTNVWLGARVLNVIDETLRFPERIGERDRLSIVLASYNSGIGHVLDARRLAVKHGEDYNSWEVVAKYLELLADPVYWTDEVVVAGSFDGAAETRALVNRTLRTYDRFCRLRQI